MSQVGLSLFWMVVDVPLTRPNRQALCGFQLLGSHVSCQNVYKHTYACSLVRYKMFDCFTTLFVLHSVVRTIHSLVIYRLWYDRHASPLRLHTLGLPSYAYTGPSRSRIWCILALKYDIWWQLFFSENCLTKFRLCPPSNLILIFVLTPEDFCDLFCVFGAAFRRRCVNVDTPAHIFELNKVPSTQKDM